MSRKLIKILPHLCNAFAIALGVIIYVDGRNPMMMFLTSTPTKVLLYAFIALVILFSFISIFKNKDE